MGSLTTCLMRAFVAGLVLSLAPVAALAEGSTPRCDLGNYDPAQRPDPEGTPTEVGSGSTSCKSIVSTTSTSKLPPRHLHKIVVA